MITTHYSLQWLESTDDREVWHNDSGKHYTPHDAEVAVEAHKALYPSLEVRILKVKTEVLSEVFKQEEV